jgi:macrolide transport system ATP-binding/permease protein
MPPEKARRKTIISSGLEPATQPPRERGVLALCETVLQDLRFAIRQLRKNPGFTFTAIVVFALGIAASTAIFAFVDAALVKPLPYRNPSQLVGLFESIPVGDRYHISAADYLDWKRLNRVFDSLDVYESDLFILKTPTGTEQTSGARVSDGFFRTLGVTPILGRDFRPGEDLRSAPQTIMLSYATWQRRFGADKSIIGRTTTMDGVPYLIIGVLPSGFHFSPVEPAEFWATLHETCETLRDCHKYYGIARLKDGVSVATALADTSSIARQIARGYPSSNRDRGATVIPLTDLIIGNIRPILIALLSGAGLLLLIGFVNVSSLLLVRAEGRRREIAVRGALGASRARLIRQFAVEGFLLAVSGCGLGLASALFAIRILPHQIPRALLDSMPYLQQLHFNAHLALFAVAVSILGGALFSATAAIQLFLSDMQVGLMEGGRTAAGRTWRKVGSSLVVVELAIAMVLLTSAGLLGKSFYNLLHVDIGMSPGHLAMMYVLQPGDLSDAQAIALERNVLSHLATLPGVTSVGISSQLAVGVGDGWAHYRVFGRPSLDDGEEAIERTASVGYFETLRTRLLRGRYFTEADDASKPLVVVINQTMAKRSFPGEDPIGKRIISQYNKAHPYEIVGVVDDLKEGPLDDAHPRAAVYSSFNQSPAQGFFVTLRSSQSEETMLHPMVNAIHQIDAGLIADGEDTMTARISNSQPAYLHRSASWVVAGFATLALLLGTVGLYGVISYSVGQRTREIGVRMALGAQRASIYQLILKEAATLATLGIASGILCSLAATRLLRSMLFGVSPWDMGALISVAFVLVASALLASYIPAHRAASINPTEALRAE